MENITTGHWIFAGIFLTAFVIFLVWSYGKDMKVLKRQYSGTSYLIAGMVILLFVLYVAKQFMQ